MRNVLDNISKRGGYNLVKKCYRVQVGAYKLGLMSKCMSKKEAEKIRHWITQGWVTGEVITGAEAAKRKKRFA